MEDARACHLRMVALCPEYVRLLNRWTWTSDAGRQLVIRALFRPLLLCPRHPFSVPSSAIVWPHRKCLAYALGSLLIQLRGILKEEGSGVQLEIQRCLRRATEVGMQEEVSDGEDRMIVVAHVLEAQVDPQHDPGQALATMKAVLVDQPSKEQ